jgi:hypothetical protein
MKLDIYCSPNISYQIAEDEMDATWDGDEIFGKREGKCSLEISGHRTLWSRG